MTIKEFQRRLAVFSVLDHAALLFSINDVDFIYKMECVYTDSRTFDFLLTPCINFTLTYPINIVLLSFERFDKSTFDIQLRHFKGFLARLSKYQLDVLFRSNKCYNLLKYSKHESFE